MPRRLSTEEALQRIFLVHGNEYEYPDFNYKNGYSKLYIKCKTHGFFKQTFRGHVYEGQGCIKCSGNETKTTTSFILEAETVHEKKYDYNCVNYINYHTKVKITCIHHGIFQQRPSSHLRGKGCSKCANEAHSKSQTKTTASFIAEAEVIHKKKYNYSNVNYTNCDIDIQINCIRHGIFIQRPADHLRGGGCPKCAIEGKTKTTASFILEAEVIHKKKYDYSDLIYINSITKVKINCIHHGCFQQRPDVHLSGSGCPSCKTFVSKPEIDWLNSLSIPENCRQKILIINNKRIKPDAYNPETNTIYEFYGNYWHGNLKIFKPNLINTKTPLRKTMQELYDATMAREDLIKNAGYDLISIWEDDWKRP